MRTPVLLAQSTSVPQPPPRIERGGVQIPLLGLLDQNLRLPRQARNVRIMSQEPLLERGVVEPQGTIFLVGLAWQRDPAQDRVERLLGLARELGAERGLGGHGA